MPIAEIFGPTIQGEGSLAGERTLFVRVGGCDFRCSWCDTGYAVLPEHRGSWVHLEPSEILDRLAELDPEPGWVTLSGGNPALFSGLGEVIRRGHEVWGYRFAMETQGSIAPGWMRSLDLLVISPKPPSASVATDLDAVSECLGVGALEVALKIPVFTEEDLIWAQAVHEGFAGIPFYLSVGNPDGAAGIAVPSRLIARYRWLVERVLADGSWRDVVVLPQLHQLIWPGEKER